jgi:hypothetical protein
MVLVFSKDALKSPQVNNEVERAVSKGLIIFPIRIDDVIPSGAMELHLSSRHWLDALTPPMENHLKRLADSIQAALAMKQVDVPPSQTPDITSETKCNNRNIVQVTTAPTVLSPPSPQPPTASIAQVDSSIPLSSQSTDYVAKGVAEIRLEDGTHIEVAATSLVFIHGMDMSQGLPLDVEILPFENMKQMELDKNIVTVLMQDGSKVSFRNDHIPPTPRLSSFFAPTQSGRIEWKNVRHITFDYSRDWQGRTPNAIITTKSNEVYRSPAELILLRTTMTGYFASWNLGLTTEPGNFLPFKKIKKIEKAPDGKSLIITTTAGLTFQAVANFLNMDPRIFGLNGLGSFSIKFGTDLKSIEFEW